MGVTLQRRFIWLSECDAEVQKCAENANGVCASGASFLIQFESGEGGGRRDSESRVGERRGEYISLVPQVGGIQTLRVITADN